MSLCLYVYDMFHILCLVTVSGIYGMHICMYVCMYEDMFVLVFLSPVPRSGDGIFTKGTTSSAPSSLISHDHTFRFRRSLT